MKIVRITGKFILAAKKIADLINTSTETVSVRVVDLTAGDAFKLYSIFSKKQVNIVDNNLAN